MGGMMKVFYTVVLLFLLLVLGTEAVASGMGTSNVATHESRLTLVVLFPNLALILIVVGATVGMGGMMKAFCTAGLIAGIGLCIFDWATSIDGFNQLMSGGNAREGMITTFLPMVFGTLALAFNATSSHFFAMFLRNRDTIATDFAAGVTTALWFGFLFYDGLSSVIGILSTFSGVSINGFASFNEASKALGPMGTIFGLLVSALLALSPFITAMFGELIRDQAVARS